ncbi:Beta-galactosidase C-terminal domain [Catenulispora rubra]|uniref:Beta-galactosidase C-terminal domain n=1 Tax=Catenulispora rubra TaxID=280293 RepID=UPI001E4C1760|nr:Beta-galactosidase C-terminal domain [Catenulispora rubra]
MVRRVADDGQSWLFAINHTEVDVPLPAPGTDLLSGKFAALVPAGGVTVFEVEVEVVTEAEDSQRPVQQKTAARRPFQPSASTARCTTPWTA